MFVGTWWSLMPPIVAIALALLTKEVYLSLFAGCALGALLVAEFHPWIAFDTLFNTMIDSVDFSILMFMILLGMIVMLMQESGGTRAYGEWASSHLKSKRSALVTTSLLGALIFVDDYFNCLTVGSVMRPVTDKYKVSRAKLAYIIDATAAPVCIIAPISSWAAAVNSYVPAGSSMSGFEMFVKTIPFNLYAILTLYMVFFTSIVGFDFGLMKKHEENAAKGDLFTSGGEEFQNQETKDPTEGGKYAKGKVIDLIAPMVVMIATAIAAMIWTGHLNGGQNLVDGKPQDAVNPLSYAILESCGRLRSTQPNLSVRYHAGMSNDFLDACVQVIRCGFGMPAFNNDEIVIPEFIKLGIEPQDAYDYAAIGCIETAVGGKWGYRCTGMSFINFARVMLAALEGGRDATSGKVFLAQEKALSAGNFNNFDEVMDAWDTQIRYYTRKSIEIEYVVDTMLEENVHDILCSALVDDCIERAKSIKQGGAKYDWVSGLQVGIANLGNSLAAVKKLVFEQGAIGQQQLAAALADDFDGLTHEQLRQRLINGAPKYGNDDDTVDTLLARAYQTYIDELKQYHNPRYGRGPVGGNYYAGTSSISANVPFGAQTMATPDGRKAHTPLAEGASPASGTDHLGPTAVIGSVGKLPTAAILGGVLLNQKLNPATLENESDKQKLMILLRTFFEVHKGWHIQYNIVSRETLLDAKKHPDQYRDLVVRVAGYSAFFTALSPDAQDDIIARTEHML